MVEELTIPKTGTSSCKRHLDYSQGLCYMQFLLPPFAKMKSMQFDVLLSNQKKIVVIGVHFFFWLVYFLLVSQMVSQSLSNPMMLPFINLRYHFFLSFFANRQLHTEHYIWNSKRKGWNHELFVFMFLQDFRRSTFIRKLISSFLFYIKNKTLKKNSWKIQFCTN